MFKYLIPLLLVVSCGPLVKTAKVLESDNVEISEVDKKNAYANCVKEKESEVDNSSPGTRRYSWQPEEIKEYCEENWRGYRD